jgi:hypothetical protein
MRRVGRSVKIPRPLIWALLAFAYALGATVLVVMVGFYYHWLFG